MIGDSIRRVRLAEDQAEDIVEAAAEQAERLMSDARNDYSLRLMTARRQARESAEGIRAAILREAAEEVASINDDAKLERESLESESAARVDLAVKRVLEIIGRDW